MCLVLNSASEDTTMTNTLEITDLSCFWQTNHNYQAFLLFPIPALFWCPLSETICPVHPRCPCPCNLIHNSFKTQHILMSSFSISIKKECLCVEWIRAELDWFDHKIIHSNSWAKITARETLYTLAPLLGQCTWYFLSYWIYFCLDDMKSQPGSRGGMN